MPKTFHSLRRSKRFFTKKPSSIVQSSQQFLLHNDEKGSLIKIQLIDLCEFEQVKQDFQKLLESNNLYLLTMPTQRLTGDFPDLVYSGHNASFMTNDSSKISMSMSKRASKNHLGVRKRIPDARFPTSTVVHVFSPRFTTIFEELEIWHKRATAVSGYPLYLHVFPKFILSEDSYKKNVRYLLEQNEPYSLFSSAHDRSERLIPASNCNTATEKALFGNDCVTTSQDEFCQQAVFNMVLKLLRNSGDYMKKTKFIKLTDGSEEPTVLSEDYLSMGCI